VVFPKDRRPLLPNSALRALQQHLLRSVPIIGNIIEIAAVAMIRAPAAVACAVATVFGASAFVAGVTSGKLGLALKAGIIAAATAIAFNAVGDITSHNPDFLTPEHIENVVGHALVGCASAEASGGQCGPAALAGAVTSFAGPVINHQGYVGGLVANTVLGRAAAVAGGGKFENGAITGAFGYMFNGAAEYKKGLAGEEMHDELIAGRGGSIIGSQLNYYVTDYEGNPVYRTDGSLSQGRLDSLVQEGSTIFWDETKNGPYSQMNSIQRAQLPAMADGRVVFFGEAAEDAGIAGQSLSQVVANRGASYGAYRLWGFGGSSAPTRVYNNALKYLGGSRGGRGGDGD
jgi:Possible hemagglutinin (DUF637)